MKKVTYGFFATIFICVFIFSCQKDNNNSIENKFTLKSSFIHTPTNTMKDRDGNNWWFGANFGFKKCVDFPFWLCVDRAPIFIPIETNESSNNYTQVYIKNGVFNAKIFVTSDKMEERLATIIDGKITLSNSESTHIEIPSSIVNYFELSTNKITPGIYNAYRIGTSNLINIEFSNITSAKVF